MEGWQSGQLHPFRKRCEVTLTGVRIPHPPLMRFHMCQPDEILISNVATAANGHLKYVFRCQYCGQTYSDVFPDPTPAEMVRVKIEAQAVTHNERMKEEITVWHWKARIHLLNLHRELAR